MRACRSGHQPSGPPGRRAGARNRHRANPGVLFETRAENEMRPASIGYFLAARARLAGVECKFERNQLVAGASARRVAPGKKPAPGERCLDRRRE